MGKKSQVTEDFMIIARIESLILGKGLEDAVKRAGAYIEAGEYLRAQIDVKQNTATFELGLNNGYLNFEKCEDPAAAKKGDKKSCKTYTPGSLIESSLQDTLKIPKERLVAAEKIDQVITAVANALIKKALNKVLEKDN